MEIKEINNKEIWESFLSNCREKTFLDSWNWGEFQKKREANIWRLGIFTQDLAGVALVVKIKAKRGTFIFVPHGPVFLNNESGIRNNGLKCLIEYVKEIAGEEKAAFIRIAPIWQRSEENIKIFKGLRFKEAAIHMHPEVTWELDITPSEEKLLMNMRKTTRYLIRQAEKNAEIQIIKSSNINDLEEFNKIYQETAKRHHFVPFSFNYLKEQFFFFNSDSQILIFLGKYKDRIVSSAIVVYWQDMAFYHHGASLTEYNKIPVSYLLQWEAIKEARARGCATYNFWGVINLKSNIQYPTSNIQKHPWAGLSLFKMGFGGYSKEYVKTQDLVLSPVYYLTYFIEKIRKLKRGL